MNIYLFLDPFPTWSQTFNFDEIVSLERLGHQVRIISLFKERFIDHPLLKQIRTKQINYLSRYDLFYKTSFFPPLNISYGIKSLGLNLINNHFHYFGVNRLRALVRKEKPDLFLVHFGALGEKFLWLKKEFGIPFVVFFHGHEFEVTQSRRYHQYQESFQLADHFLVKNRYAYQKILELGCPFSKVTVIPYGINPDHYEYKDAERPSNGKKIKILGVGRLVEFKDFSLALDVIHGCVKDYPSLQYDILGEGPLFETLSEKIKTLGLDNVCFLHGAKNMKGVSRFMAAADIYFQPTRVDRYGGTEVIANSMLEAQLHRLPVVSTRVGGVPESVIHRETGFLAEENDAVTLKQYLMDLIHNEALRKSTGERGRQFVLDQFNSKKRIFELVDVLSSFLKDQNDVLHSSMSGK